MMRYNCFLVVFFIAGSNSGLRFASAIFRTASEAGPTDFVFSNEQIHSNIHKLVSEASRSLLTNEEVLAQQDICGGFRLIADQIPNGANSCICRESQVHCTLPGQCNVDRSVCTDVVGLSFQFLVENEQVNRMKLAACFTYTEEFEATCIETLIGHGQKLDACSAATYGGKQCMCAICNDGKSLALDCSKHHPLATSNGCYRLSDAIPPLSKFDEPSQSQRPPKGQRRTNENEEPVNSGAFNNKMFGLVMVSMGVNFLYVLA